MLLSLREICLDRDNGPDPEVVVEIAGNDVISSRDASSEKKLTITWKLQEWEHVVHHTLSLEKADSSQDWIISSASYGRSDAEAQNEMSVAPRFINGKKHLWFINNQKNLGWPCPNGIAAEICELTKQRRPPYPKMEGVDGQSVDVVGDQEVDSLVDEVVPQGPLKYDGKYGCCICDRWKSKKIPQLENHILGAGPNGKNH